MNIGICKDLFSKCTGFKTFMKLSYFSKIYEDLFRKCTRYISQITSQNYKRLKLNLKQKYKVQDHKSTHISENVIDFIAKNSFHTIIKQKINHSYFWYTVVAQIFSLCLSFYFQIHQHTNSIRSNHGIESLRNLHFLCI